MAQWLMMMAVADAALDDVDVGDDVKDDFKALNTTIPTLIHTQSGIHREMTLEADDEDIEYKIDQQIERVDEYERKYLKSAPQQDYIEEKKLEGWR